MSVEQALGPTKRIRTKTQRMKEYIDSIKTTREKSKQNKQKWTINIDTHNPSEEPFEEISLDYIEEENTSCILNINIHSNPPTAEVSKKNDDISLNAIDSSISEPAFQNDKLSSTMKCTCIDNYHNNCIFGNLFNYEKYDPRDTLPPSDWGYYQAIFAPYINTPLHQENQDTLKYD